MQLDFTPPLPAWENLANQDKKEAISYTVFQSHIYGSEEVMGVLEK